MSYYTIKKLKQISDSLDASKEKLLELIMDEGKEKMREYVQQHWYGIYTPRDYERTDEVLDCISARIEGDVVIVYYDENKLSHVHNYDNWGSHIGFNDEDFKIAYIEEGIGGAGLISNPRRNDNGANAIKRLRGWLANYITIAVQRTFGLSVKVR